MKSNRIINISAAIVMLFVLYLITFIYNDSVKSIDNDLIITDLLIQQSGNQYLRNEGKLGVEEYKQNLYFNSASLSKFNDKHSSKVYLPKYKLKVLKDIDYILEDMSNRISVDNVGYIYEVLKKIDVEMNKMIGEKSNTIKVYQEEYTRIQDIIFEYEQNIGKTK